MENWGLMTFRENLLLFNPKSGSAADKQLVAIVVAHELAHQVLYAKCIVWVVSQDSVSVYDIVVYEVAYFRILIC